MNDVIGFLFNAIGMLGVCVLIWNMSSFFKSKWQKSRNKYNGIDLKGKLSNPPFEVDVGGHMPKSILSRDIMTEIVVSDLNAIYRQYMIEKFDLSPYLSYEMTLIPTMEFIPQSDGTYLENILDHEPMKLCRIVFSVCSVDNITIPESKTKLVLTDKGHSINLSQEDLLELYRRYLLSKELIFDDELVHSYKIIYFTT